MLRHALPLVVVVVAAGVAVYFVATSSGPNPQAVATEYVRAWVHHDFHEMYSLLDPRARAHLTETSLIRSYDSAAATATLRSLVLRQPGSPTGSIVPVTMRARTTVFGTLRQTLLVPYRIAGSRVWIRFSPTLLFPGLHRGEVLSRTASLPPRATLLARNGVPLAQGPSRTSPIPAVAGGIVGRLGPIPASEATYYASLGYPPNAQVGIDGLEHVFESQLAGRPGGVLRAGNRVLARTAPVPGHAVRTTISPSVEAAALTALGSHYGGIAAMDPRNGQLLALVGLAFSVLQPPGSTMKIITTTGALQAGIVKLTDTFPIATSADVGGYILHNAAGEACGGTLLNAFAVSCNSVFAPLGVRLGARRLVATAERFGFNHTFSIPGAAESQIPSASQIGSAVSVGSSAIGQGQVQASVLEMTDVAATIAMHGKRPLPTLQMGQTPHFVPVTSRRVAGLMQRLMIAVVQFGTGTAAAIPGVTVAGKTGTAEVLNTNNPNTSNPHNTDAWFVGYAPAGSPRIVAGALFANQGYGGAVAAPAIRGVLVAGLQH